jgi:hypothetical protein
MMKRALEGGKRRAQERRNREKQTGRQGKDLIEACAPDVASFLAVQARAAIDLDLRVSVTLRSSTPPSPGRRIWN